MSEQPALTSENDGNAQEGAAGAPTSDAEAPPWGDDFSADKAWQLIKNLRSDKERLQNRSPLTDEQKRKLDEYDRLAEASKSELDKAKEAAERNSQRAQGLLDRAVRAEIRAQASQGFADPSDAAAFLDLSKYTASDGDIDAEAIKADLDDLLSKKPHLGKAPERRIPAPNQAQGSSASGASGLAQLSKDDIDRMYRERRYADIDKARQEGRLDDLLGVKK